MERPSAPRSGSGAALSLSDCCPHSRPGSAHGPPAGADDDSASALPPIAKSPRREPLRPERATARPRGTLSCRARFSCASVDAAGHPSPLARTYAGDEGGARDAAISAREVFRLSRAFGSAPGRVREVAAASGGDRELMRAILEGEAEQRGVPVVAGETVRGESVTFVASRPRLQFGSSYAVRRLMMFLELPPSWEGEVTAALNEAKGDAQVAAATLSAKKKQANGATTQRSSDLAETMSEQQVEELKKFITRLDVPHEVSKAQLLQSEFSKREMHEIEGALRLTDGDTDQAKLYLKQMHPENRSASAQNLEGLIAAARGRLNAPRVPDQTNGMRSSSATRDEGLHNGMKTSPRNIFKRPTTAGVVTSGLSETGQLHFSTFPTNQRCSQISDHRVSSSSINGGCGSECHLSFTTTSRVSTPAAASSLLTPGASVSSVGAMGTASESFNSLADPPSGMSSRSKLRVQQQNHQQLPVQAEELKPLEQTARSPSAGQRRTHPESSVSSSLAVHRVQRAKTVVLTSSPEEENEEGIALKFAHGSRQEVFSNDESAFVSNGRVDTHHGVPSPPPQPFSLLRKKTLPPSETAAKKAPPPPLPPPPPPPPPPHSSAPPPPPPPPPPRPLTAASHKSPLERIGDSMPSLTRNIPIEAIRTVGPNSAFKGSESSIVIPEEYRKELINDFKRAEVKAKAEKAQEEQRHVILDSCRERNIGIVLLFLRLPIQTIEAAVRTFDELTLGEEHISGLLKIIPTNEDTEAINRWMKQNPKVSTAQLHQLSIPVRFLMMTLKVNHYKEKLQSWNFRNEFKGRVDDLSEKLGIAMNGVTSALDSPHLPRMLQFILALSNFLNSGSRYQDAKGFPITQLPQIVDFRATDSKRSFLDHLVEIVEQQDGEVHRCIEELLPAVDSASKIDVVGISGEVKAIRARLQECAALMRAIPDDKPWNLKLSRFMYDALPTLEETERLLDALNAKIQQMPDFFCEKPESFSMNDVLRCLSNFAKKYDAKRTRLREKADRFAQTLGSKEYENEKGKTVPHISSLLAMRKDSTLRDDTRSSSTFSSRGSVGMRTSDASSRGVFLE